MIGEGAVNDRRERERERGISRDLAAVTVVIMEIVTIVVLEVVRGYRVIRVVFTTKIAAVIT